MSHTRKAVSTQEAMRLLGASRSTVARLVRQGELEAYQLTPGATSPYRIYVDSIEALLRRRQRGKPK